MIHDHPADRRRSAQRVATVFRPGGEASGASGGWPDVCEPLPAEADSPQFTGFERARAFFAAQFADLDPAIEVLLIAHLDAEARLLHLARYYGDAASTALPLRAILLDAAAHATAGLLMAHNHPSGDPTPGPADLAATRRLHRAAEAIDVTLVDHLVLAGAECDSVRRMGLL